MKLTLAPRPTVADAIALAAITWGRALAATVPAPARLATEDNPRASGRRPAPWAIAAYLAVIGCNVRQADAARALGLRHRHALHYRLQTIEGLRDDPAFDAALEAATQQMSPA